MRECFCVLHKNSKCLPQPGNHQIVLETKITSKSHTISEINVFLCFRQKFTHNGGKIILGKNRQLTMQIPG